MALLLEFLIAYATMEPITPRRLLISQEDKDCNGMQFRPFATGTVAIGIKDINIFYDTLELRERQVNSIKKTCQKMLWPPSIPSPSSRLCSRFGSRSKGCKSVVKIMPVRLGESVVWVLAVLM